ncbi:hypothetical protein N5J43_27070 [Pseudomonas nicosulfuronedens]|uniref:hypothetical protein n=1 Tax=Pseudomonas nicosulfuronedens TaxID=2571105 RepID=UPI00244A801A|nr:hypothetical protein [Pseudomonas nicosulfuronedens]MDH1010655.1 hypothetical protein [Pseudomonas nicosulfuronedens]MDH1982632.1 hypothetical protein [Pseudomonas nicosulfuronedens]MDH2025854.1 hypothetical protein [Pseudomonas nicosulfuronedens]
MTLNKLQVVRITRIASYNDNLVAELLLELSELASDEHLALRTLGMIQQMRDDSKALEEVSTSIMGGCVALCFHSPAYRSANCII